MLAAALKIDIEGAEFELVDHASRLRNVDEVVGELHLRRPDAAPDVEQWLNAVAMRAGFAVVSLHHDVFALRRQ